MWLRDKAQQAGGEGAQGPADAGPHGAGRVTAWLRRAAGRERGGQGGAETGQTPALDLLPHMIDGRPLPNGVVELVVEDPHLSMRRVFDVHDGKIVSVEPGSAVPWTSIRGSRGAWAAALGCKRDVSRLHHTGELELAEKVLAALEKRRLCPDGDERRYSVLDCS